MTDGIPFSSPTALAGTPTPPAAGPPPKPVGVAGRERAVDSGTLAATAVGLAIALAVYGVLGDVVGWQSNPVVQLFVLGAQLPGPWALVAFGVGLVAGRTDRRPAVAGAWAAATLVVADVLYYAGQLLTGARSPYHDVLEAAVAWGLVAVVAGAVLGAAGAVVARKEEHGPSRTGAAVGLVAGVLLAESGLLLVQALAWTPDLTQVAYAGLDAAAALALLALVPREGRGTAGLSMLAVAATGVLLGGVGLDVLQLVMSAW